MPVTLCVHGGWKEWGVPFDTDPDWPEELQQRLTDYRQAWREKMDEVNACIAARADQEELVDQPYVDRGQVRVSGPFTMEGIIPAEESIQDEEEETPIGGAPEVLDTFEEGTESIETDAQNTEAYLDRMIRLLREDGVRFPDNKVVKFNALEVLTDGSILHAGGTWGEDDDERQVAVMFGPQYGPLIAPMVEDGIRIASRRGYDDLVFAAFSFDGAAQAAIQDDPDPRVRMHMAQIRPDVNMGDLLKTTVSSQIFTVSGMPRTALKKMEDGQYVVEMQGVDIYDPVTNAYAPQERKRWRPGSWMQITTAGASASRRPFSRTRAHGRNSGKHWAARWTRRRSRNCRVQNHCRSQRANTSGLQ